MFNNATEIQKLQAALATQVEYVKGLSAAMEKTIEENDGLKVELEKAINTAKTQRPRAKKPSFKGTPATTANTPGEYWPAQSKFRLKQEAALALHNFTPFYIVSGNWSKGSVEYILQKSILGRAVKRIRGKRGRGLVSIAEWLADYDASAPQETLDV